MDFSNYQYFLILDLEATCCEQRTIARQEMETIEIGAVIQEVESLDVVDEFTIFIKPVRHKTLTAFCTQLTSITQQDIDSAPSYPEAVKTFQEWLQQYENFIFCSWGDYDKHQLEQDSQLHKIGFPINATHVNIKKLFSSSQNLRKRYGMATALKLANLDLDGTHHRGIDDARNMARLMPYILGRKLLNPGSG